MSLKEFLIVIGLAVCFSCCHLIGRFSFPLGLIAGASAATMLIFILPAAFYLRLVKSLPLRSPQKIGVSVQKHTRSHTQCFLLLSHCIGFLHVSTEGQMNVICQKFPQTPSFFCVSHQAESLLVLSLSLSLSLQAAIFLVVGVIFMTGSLTLIVLDWIHNPPGSGGHH